MFAQIHCESFDKTFSKVFRAPAAKRRSPRARGEIPFRRFSFCELFLLRLHGQKKKRLRSLHSPKIEQICQPLFSLTPLAQMKTGSAGSAAIANDCQVNKKETPRKVSTSAEGRSCKQLPVCFAYCEEGYAPSTARAFEKARPKLLQWVCASFEARPKLLQWISASFEA